MNVYLDNSATTKLRDEVYDKMEPFIKESYGNPSSIYALARKNKIAINNAREQVANAIGANPREIYFTSGGTESDNWAIKSIAELKKDKGNHIITTNIEHPAVLTTCEYLEKNGFEISYLKVDEFGLIDPQQVKDAIKDETILISIMFANNEIGTIMPIKEIGEIAKENNIIFHTDAVQAIGHVPVNVKELNIDLLSLSGHKLYGPKGIGALYIRQGIPIPPFVHGGGQENNRRGGTENVSGIVGLGEAITLIMEEMEIEEIRLTKLRDMAIDRILSTIPYSRLNGDSVKRLPGNINISFEFIEGESMLLLLDAKGISASSGSACTSGSLDPSHVLLAIGLPHEKAHGSLRLTLGRENTKEDIDYLMEHLPDIVQRLRNMSPLYEDRDK